MSTSFPIRIETLFYREAGLDYYVAPHAHRIHQWFFCLHGGMTITVEGVPHQLQPEDSLIIAPNALRETCRRQKAPGYLVVIFEDTVIGLDAVVGRVLKMPSEMREDVLALIAEVRHPAGPESRLLTSSLILRLLIGLKRAASVGATGNRQVSSLNAGEHQQIVAQAEAFMQRNLYRQLLRAEIARAVNLSEPHLGRIFKAVTGRTVVDRLTEMRITHAKALLLESTLSVTQIAGDVGISSFSHFAKTFKRAVGVAPSDYRRSNGRAYS
ncbi:MAG: AraC family transcriptional regulator [Planctomycetes bacterium]|nr:AraC family transcriptional regulator [Planctomycetota bacterium]